MNFQLRDLNPSKQQLCSQVLSYYLQFRQDQLPSLSSTVPTQFANIQKQIINIVELRKNMEKSLELDQLQAQHFNTVSDLVERSMVLQRSVNEMAKQIRQLQDSQMSKYMESLKDIQKDSANKQSQIIGNSQKILFELNDFKRTFNVQTFHMLSQEDQTRKQAMQVNQRKHEQYFKELMQSQQKRWDLTRFVYSVKLKETMLRDQLLEQRERVHLDLERSNSDLIDTLLRQKERDKNLRKKDNQKFGQIIKQRDQIDLQNQNLNHSQKTLIPILQNQLLKIKKRLKQQQEKHQLQIQKLNKKNQQLLRQLNKAKAENKLKQEKYTQKQKQLKNKMNQMKATLQTSQQMKKTADRTLKLSQSKQIQKENELQSFKLRYKELQQTNDQLSNKNDQLQSQYNQLILKSSQLNHIKADLSQKLQKNTKRVQQFQSKLEQAKKILSQKNDQLKSLQASLNILKSQKNTYQQLISSLQKELSISKQHISQYQQKMNGLEAELTENFIIHNQQRNNLLFQLQEKVSQINSLNYQLQKIRQISQSATPLESQENLSLSLYQDIKQEIIEQMRRSQQLKFSLIDQFVDKVNHLIK